MISFFIIFIFLSYTKIQLICSITYYTFVNIYIYPYLFLQNSKKIVLRPQRIFADFGINFFNDERTVQFNIKSPLRICQFIKIVYNTGHQRISAMNQTCNRSQQIENIVCNSKNHIVLKATSSIVEKRTQCNSQNQSMYQKIIRRQSIARQSLRPTLLLRNQNVKTSTQEKVEDKEQQNEVSLALIQKIGNDIQLVPEYVRQCTKYMIARQEKYKISLQKLENHPSYLKLREDIIDWMCSVHGSMGLANNTYPIAVHFLDRHLSATAEEEQQDYYVIGLVCLFMAAKLQQTYGDLSLRTFLTSAKLKSTIQQVVILQQRILKSLQFQLVYDTPHKYFELFAKIVDLSHKNACLGQLFVELALAHKNCIDFQASKIAASAIYSIHKLRRVVPTWPSNLQLLTGYKETDLLGCVRFISIFMQDNNGEFGPNIRNKFSKESKCNVSNIKLYRKIQ